jgi:hypothetical protein
MPDTASVTSIKRFSYRGQLEEWSNTYHFTGTTPADAAAWKTLTDAIATAEKAALIGSHSIIRFYGYEPGNDLSVYQRDLTVAPDAVVAGTFPGGGVLAPGDAAATYRWQTPDFTTRGKRIYGRKYWHGAVTAGIGVPDTLDAGQRAALGVLAAKMIDGTLPGGVRAAGPQGAAFSAPFVSPWITTRTLKRRGKRPPTP